VCVVTVICKTLAARLLARSTSFGQCRNLATCVMICLNKSTVNVTVCMKWEFIEHNKCLTRLLF
jgi:hypothetical protein